MDPDSRNPHPGTDIEALRTLLHGFAGSMSSWSTEDESLPEIGRSFDPDTAEVLQTLRGAIAQRLGTQQRVQQGIEALRDGFAVFDGDLRFVTGNRAFRRFFQPYTTCPEGMSLLQLADIAIRRKLVTLPYASGREWCDAIFATIGEPMLLTFEDARWARLVIRHGHAGDLIVMVSDITHSMTREKALDQARLRAIEAGRARGSFLANMSHELRTPLNGVIGMAELLCDSGLDDERRQLAETIRSSAEALLGIINDVLDFSRGEARKIELRETDFDLEAMAAEVIMLLSRQASCKHLDLHLTYDPFLSPMIHADRPRLRQVLINLVGNAIKFTDHGRVEIQILENRRSEGVEIMVLDTGLGIPEGEADRIFEEFSQIGDDRTASTPGTGLGLAISNQIVAAMGGRLWMSSESNAGSTFGISLPVRPEPWQGRPLAGKPVLVWSPRHMRLRRMLQVLGASVLSPADRDRPFDSVICRVPARGPDAGMLSFLASVPPDRPRLAVSSAAIAEPDRTAFDTVLLPGMRRSDLLTALGSGVATQAGRQRRILAADDNATNRLVLQKMIGVDFTLTFAEDGETALHLWQRLRPDLVLMDISMPLMDGREATRRIREIEAAQGLPRTPILALTAHDSAEDEAAILGAGVDDLLTKPVRRQILKQKLARWLTGQQTG